MNPRVMNATHEDVDEVADLIARSFQGLDVAHWLAPDPIDRLEMMRAQFAILIEHAVEHGGIHLTADRSGAAVWFDLTEDLPGPPDYDRRLSEICRHRLARFLALDKAFEAHHPEAPHHHIAFVGVRAESQNQGVGSALMAHHLDALDAEGLPSYLEASSVRSRAFYSRLGYENTSVIDLPDGPQMWPMWRDPA